MEFWRMFAKSLPVRKNIGAPSSTHVVCSGCIPATAALWTLVTATPIGMIWSDYGLKRVRRSCIKQ
jgi:hypothetical protein